MENCNSHSSDRSNVPYVTDLDGRNDNSGKLKVGSKHLDHEQRNGEVHFKLQKSFQRMTICHGQVPASSDCPPLPGAVSTLGPLEKMDGMALDSHDVSTSRDDVLDMTNQDSIRRHLPELGQEDVELVNRAVSTDYGESTQIPYSDVYLTPEQTTEINRIIENHMHTDGTRMGKCKKLAVSILLQ